MARARITHLGGADFWTHPETGAALRVGDEHEADAHVQALVDDGWAEPLEPAGEATADAPAEPAESGEAGEGGEDEAVGDDGGDGAPDAPEGARKGRRKNRG